VLDRQSESFRRLVDLLLGAKIAIALRAMAEHRLADKLGTGPMPVEALAHQTGLAPEPLRRVLRALAQYGVFRERSDGSFENSNLSEYMRVDVSPSLRDAILYLNHDMSLRAWLQLDRSLKDGQSHFVEINGAPIFELFAKDKQLGDYFAQCMINLHGAEVAKIAAGYSFGQFRSLIDVGGGQGHIIAAILSVHRELKGMLFDIEPNAALARDVLRGRGLAERCEVLGGDIFVEIPRGFDAYLLKSVLHNWNDARATAILRQCRNAMAGDSRLLVVEEAVVPGRAVGNPHRLIDLEMLVHFGGKERTEPEYARLMSDAGFALACVTPVNESYFSVIEGIPL